MRLQRQAGYRCQADQQVNSVLYLIDGPLALAIAETLKDGKIVGMMSVDAVTGQAWCHTWHGAFIAMVGE